MEGKVVRLFPWEGLVQLTAPGKHPNMDWFSIKYKAGSLRS